MERTERNGEGYPDPTAGAEIKNMLIDDAIEITAWMPFPEPYKEEQK